MESKPESQQENKEEQTDSLQETKQQEQVNEEIKNDNTALNTEGNANVPLDALLNRLPKNAKQAQLSQLLMQQQEMTKSRQFWDTQPVPKFSEIIQDQQAGPIETKKLEDIKQIPYPLPEQFEWCDVNINEDVQAGEVYTLLAENYVEDDDNMFRFDYSIEFLRWALNPPEQYPDWVVGVRVKKNKKLVAFITGIVVHVQVNEQKVKMAEINFLCVHKKLRTHRLAPVLIKEITRRVNCKNIWQAIYTAGVLLPTPIGKARYFHRSLNPKKLVEVGFSGLGPNQTLSRLIKLYKLPNEQKLQNLRPMKPKDVFGVMNLLNNYLQKFDISFKYTHEEVKHWFLPRQDVMYTYVIQSVVDKGDQKEKVITDLVSFYSLPSTILKNPKHNKLRAAYSYYTIATSIDLKDLINEALFIANKEGFDVFNALDIMDNGTFLNELKFNPGDGYLNYYLYNWKIGVKDGLKPPQIGTVLF